uniref:Immunoglobulin V-set domain-containing protein n=1 Tax=Cyprinus carpio TaxID=7962 RepID=A0A8C2I645_CYPCA
MVKSFFPVCWGQDRVEQPSREMTANEADQIILMCNYTIKATNADVYLFWYKQLSNKSPAFILSKFSFSGGTTEPDYKKRFNATLDTTSRTVPLMIKNLRDLRVSDSAVYTVLVNTHTKTLCAHQSSVAQLLI